MGPGKAGPHWGTCWWVRVTSSALTGSATDQEGKGCHCPPLSLLAWWPITSPSYYTLVRGTSEDMASQRLQRAIPFHHPSVQRPCAVGQLAPSWRCAQTKDHETSPQERCRLLGRRPLASSRRAVSQEAHNSCQAAGQQEVGTQAGLDLETPSPQSHLCLIKQAHPYISLSLVRRPFLQHVSSGLHTTALCAMHQEQTEPGERGTLAGRHHRWLPGAHWPQVRSGGWWTPTVPDPTQQWWQPGSQPLLHVPEVLGP